MDIPATDPYLENVSIPALFLILACALWGVSFPIVKALHLDQTSRIPGASSEFLAAWIQVARFSLAALILLPFVVRLKLTRREIRQGLLLALWGGLGMGLQADGLAYTPASTSAFLTQAYCVILPLWACIRLRALPKSRVVMATLLVMTGGAILSGIRPGDLRPGRGELETLLAAVLFSFQILNLDHPKYEGNRSMPVTFLMCLGIAVLYTPVSLVLAPSPDAMLTAGASWPTAGFVLILALFCSVGSYLLMNHFQRKVSATEAGLIYTTEPVFTSIYALFLPAFFAGLCGFSYPNETLTPPILIGGLLILSANVLMQWKTSAQRIAPGT